MDAKEIFVLGMLLCLASLGRAARLHLFFKDDVSSNALDVTQFGAVGDGKTDDSQAFLNAWNQACASLSPPTLTVPSGKTFLLSAVAFAGPCKSSITVQILGDLLAPNDISRWTQVENWIQFTSINGLTISGSGHINGQGSSWWECKKNNKCPQSPTAFRFNNCEDVTLSKLKFIDSQQVHLAIYNTTGAKISDLLISAPEDSPNTDGIHVQDSQQVEITNSIIGTGDDCISIGTNTSNVNVTKVHCGPGHGISIGSLGEFGLATVEQVHVSNCTLNSTKNGVRIKTWQGGSGYARGITFNDIVVINSDNPVIIDQYYCNGADKCGNQTSAVQVSDVSFVNVRGTTTAETAVSLACSETVACTDITLEHVHLTSADPNVQVGSYCCNAKGRAGDLIPAVACLNNQ